MRPRRTADSLAGRSGWCRWTSKARDENPGSVAALVRLGAFEYLTCGDATSDDGKKKADTEVALVDSNAIPGGDGQRYTVTSAAGFSATYSAVDPPAGQ